jgi:hypothetical protein
MIAAAGLVLREIGRADRLMRFLRVLGLGLVLRGLSGRSRVIARRDRLARRLIALPSIWTPSVRI